MNLTKKSKLIQLRKNNARLYPIYRMFSWDLLFYYAIAFVFLTQTKGFTISMVLFTDSLYPIFKIALQLPTSLIIDYFGKRKSLIIANLSLALSLLILIFSNGIVGVLISYFAMAFAFAIKNISETNLLFDSVTVKNGHDYYTKIDEKGTSNYFYLDGISSLLTGFLYIINGYIPMIVSLAFVVISIALSSCFKDVYPPTKEISLSKKWKIYKKELKDSSKYIFNSNRLKALILFNVFFTGLLYVIGTYREGLLTFLGIPAQYFSVIIAILTFICGIATSKADSFHNKFKNKTFTFMAIVYTFTIILIGIVSLLPINNFIKIACILVLFAFTYCVDGPYYVLSERYLKSFATPNMRTKINTTASLVTSISQFVCAFLASFLLDTIEVTYAYIYTGILFIFLSIIIIKYMKPRFGLKPEQYSKKDILTLETK